MQLSTCEIDPYTIPLELLRLLPRRLAVQYSVFPLEILNGGQVLLATVNLLTPEQVGELERWLERPVVICLASRHDLAFAIRRGYGRLEEADSGASPRPLLGQVLQDRRLITPEQLHEALRAQRRSYTRLGDILLEQGAIIQEALSEAVILCASQGQRHLGEFLVQQRYISPEQLAEALELQRQRFRRLGDTLAARGIISHGMLQKILNEVELADRANHSMQKLLQEVDLSLISHDNLQQLLREMDRGAITCATLQRLIQVIEAGILTDRALQQLLDDLELGTISDETLQQAIEKLEPGIISFQDLLDTLLEKKPEK
jgi:hypothetical protein